MKTIRFIFIIISAIYLSLPVTTKAQQVYGLGGFNPVYRSGPDDLIGIKFRFKVVENESQSLRIIFGFHRLHLPGLSLNYIIETNIYSGRITSYLDNSCTKWPLVGNYIERESSLRLAIPDYAYHFGQQPGITTGIITSDPLNYPVQTYNIDNIPNLYKSDAISQFDVDGIETLITLERGDTTIKVSHFNRCERPLLSEIYRKWKVSVVMPDKQLVECTYVLPDLGARYLTITEAMNFASEFLNGDGFFTIQYWDFASIRESDPIWRSDTTFISSSNYDGNGSDFGIRVVTVNGYDRIEFSNRPGNTYITKDTQFSINSSPLTSSENNFISTNGFKLDQNIPNPFNSVTKFSFTIQSRAYVSLKVYNLLGKEVETILSETLSPGYHSIQWDASGLSNGIYFCRLSTIFMTQTKKFIIQK